MRMFMLLLCATTILSSCKETKNTKQTNVQAIGCYAPPTTDKEWYSSGKKAPKFTGLDGIDFPITSTSREAQEYFNQGMMLAYGFNHAEAARSFYEATRLDSNCAMAYWGFAYVLGPNYNGGMEEDNYQRAYSAMIKARDLSPACTAVEIALIEALQKRYQEQPPEDRSHLDNAYAAAMKKVYEQFPKHPDVGALYAESLMNLHPWDLYDKTTKTAKEWTPEIVAVLQHLMRIHPSHPGAHHFYIHAMEASAAPEAALPSARLLDSLVPGSGHLVHMPSHIYINTGNYHEGTVANLNAVAVDSAYSTACNAQGAYPLAYYPHNYHFLAATATLEGNASIAWKAALKIQELTASNLMKQPEWATLQHYYSIPYYVAVKLAMWDEILLFPEPAYDLAYLKAIRQYARGMAYLGKNDVDNAVVASKELKTLIADTSLKALTIWGINSMYDLTRIADKVLAACILYKQNQNKTAAGLFREAIAVEDSLNYNEPPDWFFSVRHHLGALLLQTGEYEAAEIIYQEDLSTWKRNGWALIGLYQSLQKQGRAEAAQIKASFDSAWKHADFSIESSSSIISQP